jgi:putative CRISPR-associated protein (TIGR02619 family)
LSEDGVAIHIVTVGVSVLANATRAGVVPSIAEAVEAFRTGASVRERLAAFVRRDPWGASAELNAMRPFLEEGSVEEVYLVATSSPACDVVVDVLTRTLRTDHGVQVSGKMTPVLPDDEEERFATSLLALWEALLAFLRRRRAEGREVLINATGGLKPELAVCLVAGNLAGVPVYYRHEEFERTIFLPTLVWAECPPPIRGALERLGGAGVISGPDAERFHAEHAGSRLEALRLIRVERAEDGRVYRVQLAPYGRLLLDLGRSMGEEAEGPWWT